MASRYSSTMCKMTSNNNKIQVLNIGLNLLSELLETKSPITILHRLILFCVNFCCQKFVFKNKCTYYIFSSCENDFRDNNSSNSSHNSKSTCNSFSSLNNNLTQPQYQIVRQDHRPLPLRELLLQQVQERLDLTLMTYQRKSPTTMFTILV